MPSTTQQRLLGLLFGQPGRSFYVTELIELANVGRGAVQRELARLEQSGLVLTEQNGNPFLKRVLEGPTVLLKGDIDAA